MIAVSGHTSAKCKGNSPIETKANSLTTQDALAHSMHIDDYGFGKIIISGKKYEKDVIVFPDHVHAGWWRQEGHELHTNDLSEVLDFRPDLLIIGTGYFGRMNVPDSVLRKIDEIGCELVVKRTREACDKYNRVVESRVAVAALHLTC